LKIAGICRLTIQSDVFMKKPSAGILPYRKKNSGHEVFLVHPGGPYWAKKDLHSWSVTKGEFEENEEPFATALREFREETGYGISGEFLALDPVKLPGGKIIYTWAVEADFDATNISSNYFSLEWPPKSGKMMNFPEVDRGGWFTFGEAADKIFKGQLPILKQLEDILKKGSPP
jgi:predicted NUDIX family NTP pyrophosphohydrolase